MAKYTAELREWFDQYHDGTKSSRDLIESGRTTLFDFDYDIFDPDYKAVFETHFIRKFYLREIGYETFGLFKFQLETWLIINMPYFNKLFESELLQYDPLTNMKMDTTSKKVNDTSSNETKNSAGNKTNDISNTRTGTTNENISTNSNQKTDSTNDITTTDNNTVTDDNFQRHLESDNPDTRLALTATDGTGVIEYASKITEDNENNSTTINNNGTNNSVLSETNSANGSQTSDVSQNETNSGNITESNTQNDSKTGTINNMEDYIEHVTGKVGNDSFAKMIAEYRNYLLRIENQIFNEMQELFMLVY